ncbi:MAG: XdhC family protein [Phycisphaerales bacterium]|nr:XdhC family protein [Phycisphaerales bacterium]
MTGEHFFRAVSGRLKTGSVVLATVRDVRGSTPRYAGAQMACGEDWCLGTIGGGQAEARVVEAARQMKKVNGPKEVVIDLRGTCEEPRDGICGGTMKVRLDLLAPAALESIEEALGALQIGQSVQQQFPDNQSWSLQVVGTNRLISETADPFYILPDAMLLIIGGGHCGLALARAAHPLGFQIVIQDDRPMTDGNDLLAEGCIKCCESVAATLMRQQSDRQLYAAIVSRSYEHDVAALEALATVKSQYIGLMGSKRRVVQVLEVLKGRGIRRDFLDRIDSPIGLGIGAETPEEIAISICARLIEVRQRLNSVPSHSG